MCGVIAVVDQQRSLTQHSLRPALDCMRRRGPDQEGEWLSADQQARLGHRRLSIVDLSEAGRQPMFNEDGSISLVCNGEIYNYPSLRARLEGLGHVFRSGSDSEVILHAYEQWGLDCVDQLIGMFAFVLWDSSSQRLVAARDHVGIKPLYYATLPSGVALSSSLDALITQLGIAPDPEPLSLAYALSMRYVPSPLAMWKGTHKLEPGHQLVWSATEGLKISRYWQPPVESDLAGGGDRDQAWQSLFHEVLSDHLLADVPIGIFLSGGLDSTSIAGGLKHVGYSATAIAASLPEHSGDEFPVARRSARTLGFECQGVEIRSDQALDHYDQLLAAYDEPEIDSGPLPMHLICQQAGRQMKVVLGGDGGDECFAGYNWYRHQPPAWTVKSAWRQLRQRFGSGDWRTWTQSTDPLLSHIALRSNPYSTAEIARLFSASGLRFDDELRCEPFRRHLSDKLPPIRSFQRMDLLTFCSDLCLLKVDRCSMHHSLEVRVPLLDRRVIEWALASPVAPEDLDPQQSKPLLRRYVQQQGLGHVLNQPKSGFSMKGSDLKHISAAMLDRIDASWLVSSGLLGDRWKSVVTRKGQIVPHKLWPLDMLARWVDSRVSSATQRDRVEQPISQRGAA